MRRIILLLTLCTILSPRSSVSQTIVWTGDGHNSLWSNPDNWNPRGLPGTSDRVYIEDDSVTMIGVSPEIMSLELKNAQLLIQGFLLIDNADTFGIKADSSKIYNQHVIEIDNAGNSLIESAIELRRSTLRNDSTVLILDAAGDGINAIKSEILNYGSIDITSVQVAAFNLEDTSAILNHGNISTASGFTQFDIKSQSNLENHDSIFMTHDLYGIAIHYSYFSNTGYIDITFDDHLTGIHSRHISVFAFSTFNNKGMIEMSSITSPIQTGLAITVSDVTNQGLGEIHITGYLGTGVDLNSAAELHGIDHSLIKVLGSGDALNIEQSSILEISRESELTFE